MAEGFKIADGYLDIEADDTGARRTLRGFLQFSDATVEESKQSFANGGLIAGKDFGVNASMGAGRELADGFSRDVNNRLRNARGQFAREGEDSGRDFGKGLVRGLGDSGGGGSGGKGGIFSSLFSGLTGAIGAGMQGLSNLGGMVGNIGTAVGAAGGLVSSIAMATAIVGLIPVAVSLIGTLLQLGAVLGMLPGLIGVAAAALLPLMIAFQGVGGALSAFMSGDMEKFNKELAKLGPHTRTVVKEMTGLAPILRDIKKTVTEAFWAPFEGSFTKLGKTLLPAAKTGLAGVAHSLGKVGAGFLQLLSAPDIVEAIGDVFESTGRIIDRLGPSGIQLFGTLIGMMEHGLPFVERFFGKIGDGMDALSGFLSGSMQDGSFERGLETAFSIMQDIWDLGKSLGGLFMAIFGGKETGEAGQGFIQTLTGISDRLTVFFNSDDGKEFIANIIDILHATETALVGLGIAIANIARWYNGFVTFFGTTIPSVLTTSKDAILGWWGTFTGWVSSIAASVSSFFASAWLTVVTIGGSIITWFGELPGKIWAFISSIPGIIGSVFQDGINRMFFIIGYGIGLAILAFTEMPGKIWAGIQAIPGIVAGIFTTARDWTIGIIAGWMNSGMEFFHALPGRISGAWSGLTGMISGFFSRSRDAATGQMRSMIDSLISLAWSLPGRIGGVFAGAGSWLYGAGESVVRGLMNGIRNMIGAAVDQAVGAMRSIVSGAKRALGIASPSKAFRDEVGKWIPPGIQQGIEAKMPALQRSLATAGQRLTHSINVAAPNVAVGGGTTIVMIDGDQIAAKVLRPGRVAAAADEGARQRAYLNTARMA